MRRLHPLIPAITAAFLLLLMGCIRTPAPLSPGDAALAADAVVDRILQRDARTPFEPAQPAPPEERVPLGKAQTVQAWFPAHPLMNRLALPEVQAAFNEANPAITLEAQPMGDWLYAIQKFAVHLAGGGLPDIAVIRRDLLAQLAGSGRIMALDALLPAEILADILPPMREAFRAHGHLVALPADGFHTVVFAEAGWEPPDLWDASGNAGDTTPAPMGHIPFLETLWARGATVLDGPHSALTTPQALQAFIDYHALYTPESGRGTAHAAQDPAHGFGLFRAQRVSATVASSREYPAVIAARPDAAVHPMPGVNGPVSRGGEYGIVVFSEARGKEDAVAAVLDFLTGSALQGAEALARGSAPIRRSVATETAQDHPLHETATHLRAPPLVPGWAELEADLARVVSRMLRYTPEPP